MVEFADVTADGKATRTVAVGSEDAGAGFGHDSSVGQRFSLEVGSARYRALQARGHRAGRRAARSFRSHFGRPVTDRGPRRFPPHWLRWAAQ
jgi:hypothetical protein